MATGWVAATVRARAMARRRVGPVLARRVADAASLDAGLALLEGTAFDQVAEAGTALRDAEHQIRAEQLWELRVLAGWLPAGGTPLARALAARFERANIEAHRDRLAGRPAPPAFALGTLALSWPRLAATSSLDELRRELGASPWGDPGAMTATELHDALLVSWLRLVAAATGLETVQRWIASGTALLLARIIATTGDPDRLGPAVRPLIGRRAAAAKSLAALQAAVPSTARGALAGVEESARLWRAEAGLRARIESDGFRMLRTARPGPAPVMGALAVLAIDGWRLRAALACAAAGTGPSEVLDVVA
ncbi:MAG TPA: hypothetical protein VFY84_20590 [Jiangellales bacterium]|nr:hypothetical protein [Jiangellales bacterium]